eukprot:CCRYP_008199-RA/>CCRYP_008199-RA protein AED:0.02 eAED:0.02 QI:411/1/1/1/1/1/2/1094/385
MSEPCTSNDLPGFLSFTRSSVPGCDNSTESVTFISCYGFDSGSFLEEAGGTPFDLEFDYELFTSDGFEDVAGAIAEFEGGLLGGVADTLGLLSCTGSVRKTGGKRGIRGLEREPDVMGISSEPADAVSDANCTTKLRDSSNLALASCTSINGYMTAWLPPSSGRRILSESDVYEAIESFISNGFTSESVIGVSYVGSPSWTSSESASNEPVITGSKTVSELNAETDASVSWDYLPGIGLLAVAVTMIALVGVTRIVNRRRQRSSSNQEEPVASEEVLEDLEFETSSEIASEHAMSVSKHVGFASQKSDTDDAPSVVTEDYTTDNHTTDEFIQRLPTYGSSWGDKGITTRSESLSTFAPDDTVRGDVSVGSMPSEMGEEIGMDDLM